MKNLTKQRLLEKFSYNKECGTFHKRYRGTGAISEKPAGSVNSDGYMKLCVDYEYYSVHRLVWLAELGELPKKSIDHINGNKIDNRFSNLRETDDSENSLNRFRSNKNKFGGLPLGVFPSRKGKFVAKLTVSGKCHNLGLFDSPTDAYDAYLKRKREMCPSNSL